MTNGSPGARRDLLAAIAGEGDAALAAWGRWQLEADLEALDPGSFRLLPALYRALERHRIEHPRLPRLRGVYRYAWAANQLTARDLLALLGAFRQAGLPVVANRGLPLVERYYGDPAGRLVDQVDLLVCAADLDAADRVLRQQGWRPRAALPPLDLRSVFSPLTYGRPGHRNVVLHGRSLLAFSPEGKDRELFDRREVGKVQGADVPMLAPLDQLILECVHHRRLAPADDSTWALDALLVIRHLGARFPWDEAWARASAMGVGQSFAARIRELRDEIGAVLPAWSLPEVPELPVADHAAASVLLARPSGSPGPARAFRRAWRRYQAWADGAGRATDVAGFLRFSLACYRYDWGVSLAGLPAEALRRLLNERGTPPMDALRTGPADAEPSR